jgi:hypothetical protein
MNIEQAEYLAEFQNWYDEISRQARSAVAKAAEVQNRGEAKAYGAITRAADKLIQKDSELTRDQAIAKALNQHPELYDAYAEEHALRIRMNDVTESHHLARINKRFDEGSRKP